MCNLDKSARPNTHNTLTATLVLQSGSSIVQIAPMPTTSTSGSIGTTWLTTASTASATPTSTTNSISSTGVSQPAAATSRSSSPEKSRPVLSTAQIAGVVVAGVGGIVLAVGIIILCACMRRKKRANRDSGYLPFQQEPSMSIKSQSHFGITKPMAPSPASVSIREPTPTGAFLGARIPITPRDLPRGNQPSPDPFFQRSAIPEGIGLAMTSESPQNNLLTPMGYTEEIFQRGPSPLLPERPNLTLQVPSQSNPNNTHTTAYHQPSNIAGNIRLSMDTQFEDDDSCSTAVASDAPWNAASYGTMLNDKILQQPDPAYYHSPRLQGELSPNATESIINSYKDPSVEPDFYVRPLNLQRNFSQPRRPENVMRPSVSRDVSVKDPLTASPSVYPAKSGTRLSSLMDVDKLNLLMQSNPSFRRILRKSAYNPTGPYDQNRASRASVSSMTSFETIDSINPEPQELAGDNNLSPVVESPSYNQHGIGKSPVKYPKINGNGSRSSRNSRARARTSITTNFPTLPPISIESPTRPPKAHSNKPWQAAEIAAQKMRMTSLGLSPGNLLSPGSHSCSVSIRKSNDFFSLTSLAPRSPPPPVPLPSPPNTRQKGGRLGGLSVSGGKRNAPPAPLGSSSSENEWRVLPDINTTSPRQKYSDSVAITSPQWRTQTLDSILKRDSHQSLKTTRNIEDTEVSSIYSQEATNFNYNPRLTQMTTVSNIRAQGQAPIFNTDLDSYAGDNTNINNNTNDPTNGKPIVYTKADGSGQAITVNVSSDNPGALPKTPGWVPKLTPTRRGNDLFLNVQ